MGKRKGKHKIEKKDEWEKNCYGPVNDLMGKHALGDTAPQERSTG